MPDNNSLLQSSDTDLIAIPDADTHIYTGSEYIDVDNDRNIISLKEEEISNLPTTYGWDVTSYTNGRGVNIENHVISSENTELYLRPEQFGAVGDGVHDDSDAIQAAIDAANLSTGRNKTVLLQASNYYKYRIDKTIYIRGGVCVMGNQRWGSWIDLYNNASVVFQHHGVNTSEEIRLKNVTIDAGYRSDYCVQMGLASDNTKRVTQCEMSDVYCQRANVAACYLSGSINYLNRCYFYYSPCGLKTYRTNALYINQCNFWDNTLSVDLDVAQNVNCTNSWFEGGTSVERGENNVQFKIGVNTNLFCNNCQFQGSAAATQKIIWQDSTVSRYNFNLNFTECRFNYAGATGPLFKFRGYDDVHLVITNSYFYAHEASAIVDNSDMNSKALHYTFNNNWAFDANTKAIPFLTDFSTAVSIDIFNKQNGAGIMPELPNGVVLGSNDAMRSTAPMSENEGYLLYDTKGILKINIGSTWRYISVDNFISDTMYGAVGNGTTDDTNALQYAINAARNSNRYVLLTKPSYKVTSTLVIPDNTVVMGSSTRTVITLYNGASIKIGHAEHNGVDAVLKNVTIDAQNTSNFCIENTSNDYTIDNVILDNVVCKNALQAGIRLYTNNSVICNSNLHHNATAVIFDGIGNRIINTKFEQNPFGVAVHKVVFVDNCYFNDDNLETIYFTLDADARLHVSNSTFTGNYTGDYIIKDTATNYWCAVFDNCSFIFPNITNSPFVVAGNASNTTKLGITHCSCSIPNINYLVYNVDVPTYKFVMTYADNYGMPTNIVTNNNLVNFEYTLLDNNNVNIAKQGIAFGSTMPTASTVNDYNGFVYFDNNIGKLRCTYNQNSQIIPVRATTHVQKLGSGATQGDVVNKLNELISVLGNETLIIDYN